MMTCGNFPIGHACDLLNIPIGKCTIIEFWVARVGWTPHASNVGLLVLT